MASLSQTVEVSTPGKVLVCGGYVVLNGGHSLVLSTNSRFKSTLSSKYKETQENGVSLQISVVSPQFGKTWVYHSSWNFDAQQQISQFSFLPQVTAESGSNPYVENAVFYALATAVTFTQNCILVPGQYLVTLTINADNDFYSHSKAVCTIISFLT
jgi:phosphomevalonate kinase